jgi:hypothetical protein
MIKRVAPESLVEQRAGLELDGHTGNFRVLAQKIQPKRPMGIGICVQMERYANSCLG